MNYNFDNEKILYNVGVTFDQASHTRFITTHSCSLWNNLLYVEW